jgi:hypothetical protein
MNYLVLRYYLNYLKFTSRFCTVTIRYYYTFGFYTFVGFQRYIICEIWFSRLISIDFTSCSKFERNLILFEFRQATWRFLTGRYHFGWIRH